MHEYQSLQNLVNKLDNFLDKVQCWAINESQKRHDHV